MRRRMRAADMGITSSQVIVQVLIASADRKAFRDSRSTSGSTVPRLSAQGHFLGVEGDIGDHPLFILPPGVGEYRLQDDTFALGDGHRPEVPPHVAVLGFQHGTKRHRVLEDVLNVDHHPQRANHGTTPGTMARLPGGEGRTPYITPSLLWPALPSHSLPRQQPPEG